MKRGFLNNNPKPLYEHFSGSYATHQAVWESLSQRGPMPATVDITEAFNSNRPTADLTSASGEDESLGINVAQSLPRPSFEDKTKSVLIPNLIHRIPSLFATQGREPSSYCLLWSTTLEKIINTAGYPATLPKTRLPDLFTIKSTPNMGLGLFAKHDINVSELVLAERPLIVVPPMTVVVANSPEQLSWSAADICRSGIEQNEKTLEHFLSLMTRADADAFKDLENRYTEDGYNLFGIVLTNGYPMNFGEGDDILKYHAVANKGSRINHSCTPNLFVEFDTASFTLQYTALRDIKAGEQLFYAYCHPMQKVKERQEDLGKYKFTCRCTACENATPESDEARVRYGIEDEKMSSGWAEVLSSSEFNGDSLESLLDMEKEMMKEGLDFWVPFPLLLDAIAKVYTKLDDQEKASEYKEKLVRYNPTILKIVEGG